MINPKRLIQLAKKWQRIAASKPRRITFPRNHSSGLGSLVANESHFVVYSTDNKRFVVPLEYLNRNVFRELLVMSEEEFGLPTNGPITLPCDSTSYSMFFCCFEDTYLKRSRRPCSLRY